MANKEQLELLKAGVEGWNQWRRQDQKTKIDLSGVDLGGFDLIDANLAGAKLDQANLSGAKLIESDLRGARLERANLSRAKLERARLSGAKLGRAALEKASLARADLSGADLRGAVLEGSDLERANLSEADLTGARLKRAHLSGAILCGAKLIDADLSGADLSGANLAYADLTRTNLVAADLVNSNLVHANVDHANVSKSKVYGINVWDLLGDFQEQQDLIITPEFESVITVDDIEIAQFVYLILNNRKIRDVINTLTSKTVLILGRFAIPERKAVLDTLREKLRDYDLLPIVFDFDRPTDKDFTETIKTLASISYFVIADVTNPRSSPLELQATIPDYQIPFVPILQEGEKPFA
ncbi:MAG TPA: pentapeptide repeat-containing protein, partial [Anaerolineales bacterium]|nr:pentapeptide repeat-containing protein [Anaerolineales bacterium]